MRSGDERLRILPRVAIAHYQSHRSVMTTRIFPWRLLLPLAFLVLKTQLLIVHRFGKPTAFVVSFVITTAPSVRRSNQKLSDGTYGSPLHRTNWSISQPRSFDTRSCSKLILGAAATEPDLFSTDPWKVLGLPVFSELKDIKRAYKRLAMKYHPDITTNRSSSEKEKKEASDKFAKINWAYQTVAEKQRDNSKTSASSSSSRTRSSTQWEPPHRRSGSYGSSTSSTSNNNEGTKSSVDWRDYMPNYENEDAIYDAGGDSFGKIFGDMFKGAATSVATGGAGGVFRDFVEFLEQQVDGYGGNNGSDNTELQTLLRTGSFDDIRKEMDDTELVVQQLTSKLRNVMDELVQAKADLGVAIRYMEKLEYQERVDELEVRKVVVDGYIQKATKRLLSLQTRYKELIVNGRNDGREDRQSSSYSPGWDDIKRDSDSSSPSSSTNFDSYAGSTTSQRVSTSNGKEDAWKTEGFGNVRGSGGGSRRRAARRTTTTPTTTGGNSNPKSNASDFATSNGRSNKASSVSSSTSSTSTGSTRRATPYNSSRQGQEVYVPPHRRQSTFSQRQDDERRLREIKVDEAFDELKKELGL